MGKIRLDVLLTERGLVASRSLAQRLIMAGQVRVEGEVNLKPSTTVDIQAKVQIDRGPRYVSRGGEKLEAALKAFYRENLSGVICADVGASTGGFTDCLLQHGANKVYAIDVGYGILHWKLRQDRRVVSMERTNARNVHSLPEPVGLVTIDASFISLRILLPVIMQWFGDRKGEVIALVKPQFEAGRQESARGEGVIRSPVIHRRVLTEVIEEATHLGFSCVGVIRSPLLGPKGNTEFLVHLVLHDKSAMDYNVWLDKVIAD